jgi:hypothetical protein
VGVGAIFEWEKMVEEFEESGSEFVEGETYLPIYCIHHRRKAYGVRGERDKGYVDRKMKDDSNKKDRKRDDRKKDNKKRKQRNMKDEEIVRWKKQKKYRMMELEDYEALENIEEDYEGELEFFKNCKKRECKEVLKSLDDEQASPIQEFEKFIYESEPLSSPIKRSIPFPKVAISRYRPESYKEMIYRILTKLYLSKKAKSKNRKSKKSKLFKKENFKPLPTPDPKVLELKNSIQNDLSTLQNLVSPSLPPPLTISSLLNSNNPIKSIPQKFLLVSKSSIKLQNTPKVPSNFTRINLSTQAMVELCSHLSYKNPQKLIQIQKYVVLNLADNQ